MLGRVGAFIRVQSVVFPEEYLMEANQPGSVLDILLQEASERQQVPS